MFPRVLFISAGGHLRSLSSFSLQLLRRRVILHRVWCRSIVRRERDGVFHLSPGYRLDGGGPVHSL